MIWSILEMALLYSFFAFFEIFIPDFIVIYLIIQLIPTQIIFNKTTNTI